MKQNNSPQQSCPTPVDLSAWLDDEHPEALDAHVAVCDKCRRVVTFYRYMDHVVRNASKPDSDLAERISCACREHSGRTYVLPMPFLRNSFKIAAAVAVLAGAGFWLVRMQPPRVGPGSTAVAMHAASSAALDGQAARPPLPAMPNTVVVQPAGAGSRLGGRISAASVRMASTQPGASMARRRGTIRSGALLIPGHVSQVWVVSNLKQSSNDFLRLLPARSRLVDRRELDGAIDFRIVLPDGQLPGLVDSLARKGYALISPNGPQPETPKQAWRVTNKNVWYDVRLVSGRRPE